MKHCLCVILICGALGCDSNRLETAHVRGTVTLDGQPYTQGGTVLFHPEASGKMATGTIQTDGAFELSTYEAGDGAVVGTHRVSVLSAVPPTDEAAEGQPAALRLSSIPKKYASPERSGLRFEVRPGEAHAFPIDLKTK